MLTERFWSKVHQTPCGGCWLWTASTNWRGYGEFRLEGKNRAAHRLAYESEVGPIPDGYEIDHLCRVRNCVNPAHLEAVTHRENLLRGETLPARAAAKTHCPQGHPYSGDNLYVYPSGKRRCVTCRNEQRRAS